MAASLKKSAQETVVAAVRISLVFSFVVVALVHRMPSPVAILFICTLPVGMLLWKIPPFEVGPRPGIGNGFLAATGSRALSAVKEISAWAGASTVCLGLGAVAVELFNHHDSPRDWVGPAGEWSVWGLLVGGVAGNLSWACRRTIEDIRILKSRQR